MSRPPGFEASDWKDTKLPKLAQLDSLQRCLICKDFLKAPVSTSCNHTFCSQCIREHLLKENLCPLCKSEQFESNLKRDILLEEIVVCFQSLRDELFNMVSNHNERAPDSLVTSRNGGESSRNVISTTSSPDPEVIEVTDESDLDRATVSKSSTPHPPSGTAECPICGDTSMSAEYLQLKHIDECLSGRKKKLSGVKRKRNEISLFFQPKKKPKDIDHQQFYFGQADKHHHETKRMPRIDFGSLSTPKLKEKLAALKVSVLGLRPQLELRYNQYMLYFNSNLDTNRPVSELELRQKLNQWEKSHLAFKPQALNSIFGDSLAHKNISDKDFPIKVWEERYREEFRDLVRAARRSRKVMKVSKKDSMDSKSVNLKSVDLTSVNLNSTIPMKPNSTDSTIIDFSFTSNSNSNLASESTADTSEYLPGSKSSISTSDSKLRSTIGDSHSIRNSDPGFEESHSASGEIHSASGESFGTTGSSHSSAGQCQHQPGYPGSSQSNCPTTNDHIAGHAGLTPIHPSSPHGDAGDLEIGNMSKGSSDSFDFSTLMLFVPLKH